MLGRLGYRVTVFEKRADMRQQSVDAGRSINLALAQRGIHALEKADLMEEVEKLLIPMRGRMLHSVSGELDFSPYGQREEEVIYSVSRSGLNELMMTAAESSQLVDLKFEQDVQSIDFENKQITLQDLSDDRNHTAKYEVLLGTDGAGSRVRRALLAAVGGNDHSELLDHDYKELTIPSSSDGSHLIDRESLHIWPRGGYMLIALPNLDGSFTVTLFLQKQGSPSFADLNDKASVDDFFKTEFPDAFELIPNVSDEFFANPTGILGTVRCTPWRLDDSVLLLGDASHAIVPFHGQGMNSGFEDCALFIDLLAQHDHDWPAAMADFDRNRKDDADAIADMALENYITMRDSVTDAKFRFKKKLGFLLEQKFPERFVPRYSLVMFHRLPYSQAYKRGQIQNEILNELTEGCRDVDEVDLAKAAELIESRLDATDFSKAEA